MMKSRSIKRIGVAMLAVIMLLCTNLTSASAENIDDSGRDWDHAVSLTLTKYEKDEDAVNVSDQRPLVGIPFKLAPVELKSGMEQGSTNPNDYNVVGPAIEKSTVTGGVVTWSTALDGLTQGIYLVTELPSATVSSPNVSFLVSLPMYTNGAWVYDVVAYPKNDVDPGPAIEKDAVTAPSAGNIITWEYKTDIPGDIKDAQKYVITDILDAKLTYVNDSIAGWYVDQNSAKHNLTAGTHYSVSYTNANKTLVITILQAGFDELAKAYINGSSGTPKLHFTFDTSVSTTDSGNTGEVENGGTFEYINEDGNAYTTNIPDDEKPSTDMFGIHIYKINVNEMPLKDAEFMLYKDERCRTEDLVTSDVYTTDQNGNAYIYGLAEGTYYLKETQAPAGYNAITTPIKVEVNETAANASYMVKITVTNSNGFTLPQTGGTGTLLFTIGGLGLIGVAFVLLLASKRKKRIDRASR